MPLQRTLQMILEVKLAIHDLEGERDEPEDFLRHFRMTLTQLMAIGPVMESETPNAPKGWWENRLQPDATNLMKLREEVLKRGMPGLDANFQPVSPLVAARRLRGKVKYSVGATHYLPNWRIESGPYAGRDPVEVLTDYLKRLESLLPGAEKYT